MNADLSDTPHSDLAALLACWHSEESPDPSTAASWLERLRSDEILRRQFAAEIHLAGLTRTVQAGEPRWLRIEERLDNGEAETNADEISALDAFEDRIMGRLDSAFPAKTRLHRSGKSSWLAAAAGLVIGLFGASVVWAYVVPKPGMPKVLPIGLHDAGFESGISPISKGIPDRTAVWSGDFSQVTGPDQGIVPGEGHNMLQILRADHEGTSPGERSYVGEASQVIDLHSLRSSLGSLNGVVKVSARFNAITADSTEFAVKAGTFRGEITDAPIRWSNSEEARSWATRSVAADSDRGTWQEVSVLLAIPDDADFLVLNCGVVGPKPSPGSGAVAFPGHYIDDVRLELRPAN
jgi:hypothetical protein